MEGLRVVFQAGTGYDLLISCTGIADRSAQRRVDAVKALRQRAEKVDGGEVVKAIERVGREPFLNLLGFVHSMTNTPSAENAVEAVATAEPREVLLAALGYHRRAFRMVTPPTVIRDAVDGDKEAAREFARTSWPELTHWQGTLKRLLPIGVDEAHAAITNALRGWLEGSGGFGELAPDIAKAQEVNVKETRAWAGKRGLDEIMERVLPSITFTREIGQEQVVLTPSVVVKPGFAMSDYGSTFVICFPINSDGKLAARAEAITAESRVPPDKLVRRAKAMGDELRLRALRELRDGPMSATDLARRLGVPRTSIHHHLGLLISAGLVRLAADDARWGNIELRQEGVTELTELAQAWLLGEANDTN